MKCLKQTDIDTVNIARFSLHIITHNKPACYDREFEIRERLPNFQKCYIFHRY